ncbi:major facilitator superfamily domain-containing protein [Xylariales sp. PMI_506]|nr:major facilitator superfamily domain-containing protein [Xylariales sp. PMI_506]
MCIYSYRYLRRKFGSKDKPGKTNKPKPQKTIPPCRHRIGAGQDAAVVVEPTEKCIECQAEKRALRSYRVKIIGGLILPFVLQSLDVTIVASALPWIASDFNEVSQLNWIVSAFNLTSAAFIPFWGQMADIFGRHWALQSTLVMMLIGSALCTGAPTDAFGVLLLGRALQGLGCAGIGTIVRIVLADKVSLKENARNWTIFSFTGGIGYGIGPVIGGYLTTANWRWCFGINLPIAFVAIVIIFFIRGEMLGPQPIPELEGRDSGHRERFAKRLTTLDVGGQLLFLFGFGLVILALTWAGATYNWNSVQVLSTLIIGSVLVTCFIVYEYLMKPGNALGEKLSHQKPMLPWKLLQDRNISLLFYINAATGMAMYSVFYFTDLYFTMVMLYDSSKSGIQLLYYVPGLGAGTYITMFMCNRWPRKTFYPLFLGSIIEAVGVGVLAYALHTQRTNIIYGMLGLTGCGTGMRFMPGGLHAVGFFPKNIATVVALMGVALPFGGTLALTIMSTVFNNVSGIGENSSYRDFSSFDQLTPEVLAQVVDSAKKGIVWAFVAIIPFMVLCMVCAACLGNVDIGDRNKSDSEDDNGVHLTHGSYLLAMFRGETNSHDSAVLEEQKTPRGVVDGVEK